MRGGASDPRVKDQAGNALAANVSWSFTTAAPPSCPCSIWSGVRLAGRRVRYGHFGSVELGVKFRSDVNGFISGIRFYKGPANTGTHVGTLWSAAGAALAQATFVNETASGWQQVLFATPVAGDRQHGRMSPRTHAPSGGYSVDRRPVHHRRRRQRRAACVEHFAGRGGNGVYAYAPGSAFPASNFQATNYWVDVVFDTTAGGTTDTTSIRP